jgi:hypothetical protein
MVEPVCEDFQLHFEFLPAGFSLDAESACFAFATVVRESEKIECVRLAFVSLSAIVCGKASEFDGLRFLLRYLQVELRPVGLSILHRKLLHQLGIERRRRGE